MTLRKISDIEQEFVPGQILHAQDLIDLSNTLDNKVSTAVFKNAQDPNLAGLQVMQVYSGNTFVYAGAGSLTTGFSPNVNSWYKLVDSTDFPELALFQGSTQVVVAVMLPTNLNSTLIWSQELVKYDSTGIFVQLQTAPQGSQLAFKIVCLFDRTLLP